MDEIVFSRLSEVDEADLIALWNDPLVRQLMPGAAKVFGPVECAAFVAAKERMWSERGFGPWAFLVDGAFAGWGGPQPQAGDVDLTLVLRPEYWSHGPRIYDEVLRRAFEELGCDSVIALYPLEKARIKPLLRRGFEPDGRLKIQGVRYQRFRLRAPGRGE